MLNVLESYPETTIKFLYQNHTVDYFEEIGKKLQIIYVLNNNSNNRRLQFSFFIIVLYMIFFAWFRIVIGAFSKK
jgi:hypothetical protein